jgi:hypothetical protein
MTAEICPSCGIAHANPFSDDVLALARRVLQHDSGEERNTLILELADLYVQESDVGDLSVPEDLHVFVEDCLQAETQVTSANLRLGRFLLRAVEAFNNHQQGINEDLPDPTAKSEKVTGPN